MKNRKRYLVGALMLIVCLLGAASIKAQAQSGGGYDLTWNTLESGGRLVAPDGSYSLSGSLGQTDASAALNGSGYSLVGGFWSGFPVYRLDLPFIKR